MLTCYDAVRFNCLARNEAQTNSKQGKEAEDQSPVRNPYKIRSFQRAIQAIEGLEQPIEKPEDVQGVRQLLPPFTTDLIF